MARFLDTLSGSLNFNASAAPSGRTRDGRTIAELLTATRAELDALYRGGWCALPPSGELGGQLSLLTGSPLNPAVAALVGRLWRGKFVKINARKLYNNVLGRACLPAKLIEAQSAFDGATALIASYPRFSPFLPAMRNEFRAVGERLYVGRAYLGRHFLFDFVLYF